MEHRLKSGGTVILDGGTGTELQHRGVPMDPDAWCGPVALENANVLEAIHRDYIAAGADIITANTYASSRLMLGPAGLGDRVGDIVRTAVDAAHRAREAGGRNDVLIAGSLSHMSPMIGGTGQHDLTRAPSLGEMAEAFEELAHLLRDSGCDLILLQMMYRPERLGIQGHGIQGQGYNCSILPSGNGERYLRVRGRCPKTRQQNGRPEWGL